jgi:uncharacterized membrane protein YfcA
MFNRTILTVILGLLSGVLGGALGLGGPMFMLPGVLLLGIISDYKTAVGTMLFSLLPPISLLAVIEFYKNKKVDTYIGIILCITYVLGSYYGSFINDMYSIKFLQYCSAFSFLIISAIFFYMAYNQK